MHGTYTIQRNMKNSYKILVGKSQGKISLGRPRQRWEDSIKMDQRTRVFEYGLE
jgi:hypothetical protein